MQISPKRDILLLALLLFFVEGIPSSELMVLAIYRRVKGEVLSVDLLELELTVMKIYQH